MKISVRLFRVYLGMVTCFRAHLCWGGGGGGGGVMGHSLVYIVSRFIVGVSVAFWTTIDMG